MQGGVQQFYLRNSASPAGSALVPACCCCMAWLASRMARKMSLLRLVGWTACAQGGINQTRMVVCRMLLHRMEGS